jgi:hypothetical protein
MIIIINTDADLGKFKPKYEPLCLGAIFLDKQYCILMKKLLFTTFIYVKL